MPKKPLPKNAIVVPKSFFDNLTTFKHQKTHTLFYKAPKMQPRKYMSQMDIINKVYGLKKK